ncbi:MAG: glycosyltransferase [Phormidesmis sp.]
MILRNKCISVIVPTRNRSFLLDKALQSLCQQTIDSYEFETVVVDNGSTDNTKEIVNKYKSLLPHLKYLYESAPGLHAGRHRGFLESHGDILVYADDDIQAFPTWLATIKQCFQNSDVVMVGGKNLPHFESYPPIWLQYMWKPPSSSDRILGYLSILDLGDEPKIVSPSLIFGCNFSIRRHILEEAGGFHPDGMPQHLIRYRGDGESYVSQYVFSKKYKTLYHPDASVYHWVPTSRMTVGYFCRRAYNQGISDSYSQLRRAHGLSPQLNVDSLETSEITPSFSLKTTINHWFRREPLISVTTKVLKKIISLYFHQSASLFSIELEQVQCEIQAAYKAGYIFHQKETMNDSVLLSWVLKPTYWDYCLPKNSIT